MNFRAMGLNLCVFYLVILSCITSCEKFTGREKVVPVSEEFAIKKAQQFCTKFNLACNGIKEGDVFFSGYLSWMFEGEYSRLHSQDKDYYRGKRILFEEKTAYAKGIKNKCILLNITDKLKEVEEYANYGIQQVYFKKYGFSHKTGRFRWPEFLPEKKAKEIIDSIAEKLEIPSDMVFEKIEKSEEHGFWNAIWLRKRNGYKYEGDAISISIMGATGEFVAYVKTYRGVPTSTEMKISQEKAIQIGWERFKKCRTWKMKGLGDKAKDLYEISTEPLIIQTGPFGSASKHIQIEGSKLAWIVKFKFTGGYGDPGKNIHHFYLTEEERKAVAAFDWAVEKKWREFGAPEREFEIRIDAATGRVLYASPVWPWYMRWFREWTIEKY